MNSDYFPLSLVLKLENVPTYNIVGNVASRININLNFACESRCQDFFERLYTKLIHGWFEIPLCQVKYCGNLNHKTHLDQSWLSFSEQVARVGKDVLGIKRQNASVVPGWNNFVREYFNASRKPS